MLSSALHCDHDFIILDSYNLSRTIVPLRCYKHLVQMIDDPGQEAIGSTLVSPFAVPSFTASNLNPVVLRGAKYAIFTPLKNLGVLRKNNPEVLLTLGNSAPQVSEQIVDVLIELGFALAQITCPELGMGVDAGGITKSEHDDMLLNARHVITAGGVTQLELIATLKKGITIPVADNQLPSTRYLEKYGLTTCLEFPVVARQLAEALDSPARYEDFAFAPDGQGASRLIRFLEDQGDAS